MPASTQSTLQSASTESPKAEKPKPWTTAELLAGTLAVLRSERPHPTMTREDIVYTAWNLLRRFFAERCRKGGNIDARLGIDIDVARLANEITAEAMKCGNNSAKSRQDSG